MIHGDVRVISAPEAEPITLTEAKLHLRETLTAQDTLITALLKVAREYAERYTGRALMTQTLELSLPCFPAIDLIVPRPPLQSVSWIKYIDDSGVLQTLDPSLYQIDTYREPARIKPAYGESWPSTRNDYGAVQVRYVAGYANIGSPLDATDASGVPECVKHWMKMRVAQFYEQREATVVGLNVSQIPRDYVDGLIDWLRVDLVG